MRPRSVVYLTESTSAKKLAKKPSRHAVDAHRMLYLLPGTRYHKVSQADNVALYCIIAM